MSSGLALYQRANSNTCQVPTNTRDTAPDGDGASRRWNHASVHRCKPMLVWHRGPSINQLRLGELTIRVDAGTDSDVESYLQFSVAGGSGSVVSAKLRIYRY